MGPPWALIVSFEELGNRFLTLRQQKLERSKGLCPEGTWGHALKARRALQSPESIILKVSPVFASGCRNGAWRGSDLPEGDTRPELPPASSPPPPATHRHLLGAAPRSALTLLFSGGASWSQREQWRSSSGKKIW